MPRPRRAAIYYGLGVTEHSQGSTTVMGIANLAMATRQHRAARVGGTRCVARATCRAPAHGPLPHELPGYRRWAMTRYAAAS